MKALTLLAAAATGLAAATLAFADDEERGPGHGHMHRPMASVEHAAMHNLVVAALAVKTGRSQDDISRLFENNGPPEVAKQLGLDEDAMHGVVANAHRTLIERMAAARLLTPEQADKLKSEPLALHHHAAFHEHGEGQTQ